MKTNTKRNVSWAFGILGFVIVLGGCLYLHKIDSGKYDAIVSIVGSVASFAGILVAVGQLHSVKSRTKEINDTLGKTMTRVEDLNIFADINKHSQFVNEIEEYIRSGKYEQALITYKDLKDRLNQLYGYVGNRDDLKSIHEKLQKIIDTAGNDVKNLNEIVLRNRSFMIDNVQMTSNLEDVKTFMEQASGTIKSRRDDKRLD